MKICFLTSQYPPDHGGISTYANQITKALVKRDHEVLVLTRNVKDEPKTETMYGVDVCRVPGLRIPPLILSHGFVSSLRLRHEFKPDVLHVNHPGVWLWGKPCRRIVTTIHTTIGNEQMASVGLSRYAVSVGLTWPILRGFERDLAKKSTGVICVSQETATSISKAASFPVKVRVMHNGVSAEWFTLARSPLTNMILYVGSLVERKGVNFLLHAFKEVKSRFPSAELVIVGNGPLKRQLSNTVQRLEMGKSVLFTGPANESRLLELYSKATCLVLPSLFEDCPYSVLQALAAGVPVISTRVGGIPEIVQDSGILVPPRDSSSLADAIIRIMSDKELSRSLVENGRRLALRRYTIEKCLDSLEEVYAEVLAT